MRRDRGLLPTGLLSLGLLIVVVVAACGDSTGPDDTSAPDTSSADTSATSLVGQWTVATYLRDGALVPTVADTSPTVEFLEDGSVVGSTGCNRFGASWTGEGNELGITPLATTKMACVDEAASAQEQALVIVLPTVAGWRSTADGAELLDATGSPIVNLVPTAD